MRRLRTLSVHCDACTRGVVHSKVQDVFSRTCTVCLGRGSLTYVRVAELVRVRPAIVRRLAHMRPIRAAAAARLCKRLLRLVQAPQPAPLFRSP